MTHKHMIKFTVAAALALLAATPLAAEVKKCKDATGKWHYGDQAARECAQSKIEVLSNEGVKTKEIGPPPTKDELAKREREKEDTERTQRAAEEQEKRDQILLSTYGHEDDITLVRDRKLAQLESTIKASNDTLKSLRNALERMEVQAKSEQERNDTKALAQTQKGIDQTKGQILRHEALVAQKREEQQKIRTQYTYELGRYREIKLKQQMKQTP